MTIHLERKEENAEAAARRLLPLLVRKDMRQLSPADAAAVSGLPLDLAQMALLVLAKGHGAKLKLSEAGELSFTFASWELPHAPWWEQRLIWYREQWRRHRGWLMPGFTAMLAPPILLWASGNLLAWYSIPQLPAALAYPICLAAGFSASLALVVWAYRWWSILLSALVLTVWTEEWGWMTTACMVLGYTLLLQGSAMFGSALSPKRKKGKRFDTTAFLDASRKVVQGIFWGPPEGDPLEDEARLTAFVVKNKGVVGAGELMALMGWDRDGLERALPRLVLDYKGELQITSMGGMLVVFDALKHAHGLEAQAPSPLTQELEKHGLSPKALNFPPNAEKTKAEDDWVGADTRWAHERLSQAPQLWAAPWWAVLLAFGMAGLGVGALVLHPGLHLFPSAQALEQMRNEDVMLVFMEGQGLWPYLLLILPTLLRLPKWLHKTWQHHGQKGLFQLLAVVGQSPQGAWVPQADLKALARLGGDLDPERSQKQANWVFFPSVASEARALARLRGVGQKSFHEEES